MPLVAVCVDQVCAIFLLTHRIRLIVMVSLNKFMMSCVLEMIFAHYRYIPNDKPLMFAQQSYLA